MYEFLMYEFVFEIFNGANIVLRLRAVATAAQAEPDSRYL